ncbi:MAG: glycosyltransferase family 4 protein [Polyangiaceae bacterium]
MARVLFISKPIAPPWHDGSKNLVRDVTAHLTRAEPTVLTTPGAPPIGPRVKMEPIYRDSGGFAPGLLANARVMERLLKGDPHDIWNFFFAPNMASSTAARLAKATRRAMGWKGMVVQTVASAPREFRGVSSLIFGNRVVALSEWTRASLVGAGLSSKDISVIPPCAAAPREVLPEDRALLRKELDLGAGPLVVYPGDYETSHGAETVARAIPLVLRAVPEARFVFACRPKTKEAESARQEIVELVGKDAIYTRHVGELKDITALLAEAKVIAFPVDDLYGKVDLPLVLLEALALKTPLVLARGGPLEAISSAHFVEPSDHAALASKVIALLQGTGVRDMIDAGRALYDTKFSPKVVAAAYDDLYDRKR